MTLASRREIETMDLVTTYSPIIAAASILCGSSALRGNNWQRRVFVRDGFVMAKCKTCGKEFDSLTRKYCSRTCITEMLREVWKTDEFRRKTSEGTKRAMHSDGVRGRHLSGLMSSTAVATGGNFKGGNGQDRNETQKFWDSELVPLGFEVEFVVKTHSSSPLPPNYKIDYAMESLMIAIELDGPSHKYGNADRDQRKTECLRSLGWEVFRLKHK